MGKFENELDYDHASFHLTVRCRMPAHTEIRTRNVICWFSKTQDAGIPRYRELLEDVPAREYVARVQPLIAYLVYEQEVVVTQKKLDYSSRSTIILSFCGYLRRQGFVVVKIPAELDLAGEIRSVCQDRNWDSPHKWQKKMMLAEAKAWFRVFLRNVPDLAMQAYYQCKAEKWFRPELVPYFERQKTEAGDVVLL